jgi:hypothetical protein
MLIRRSVEVLKMARRTKADIAAENARLSRENEVQRVALRALALNEKPDFTASFCADECTYTIRTFAVTRACGGVVVETYAVAGEKLSHVHADGLDDYAAYIRRQRKATPVDLHGAHERLSKLDDVLRRALAHARETQTKAWG